MSRSSLARAASAREAYECDIFKYNDISDLKTETIDYGIETQL